MLEFANVCCLTSLLPVKGSLLSHFYLYRNILSHTDRDFTRWFKIPLMTIWKSDWFELFFETFLRASLLINISCSIIHSSVPCFPRLYISIYLNSRSSVLPFNFIEFLNNLHYWLKQCKLNQRLNCPGLSPSSDHYTVFSFKFFRIKNSLGIIPHAWELSNYYRIASHLWY